MSPALDTIPSDARLPARVDAVVIGAGIVGTAAAYYLAQRGISVALVEKGVVGGEQSSRNWGWCRQQNRAVPELPLAIAAMRLWDGLAQQVGPDIGFRRGGLLYATEDAADLARWEAWQATAKPFGVDTRMLSAAEAREATGGNPRPWVGGVSSPTDGTAEPARAAPALAAAARRLGATLHQGCAARVLDVTNGAVTGVVTEQGLIRTGMVLCAGGAWASAFCRHHGIDFPQASARTSILRTRPAPAIVESALYTPGVALTRREDGGYTIAISGKGRLELTPQAIRYARQFLPMFFKRIRNLEFGIGGSFLDGPEAMRRWGADSVSPFERIRVLDPAPDPAAVALMLSRARALFPALQGIEVAESWASYIDSTPDAVPVISPTGRIAGFHLAAGFSGHGFGLGPGAGHLAADLMTGQTPIVDPRPYRLSRFSEGKAGEIGDF